jgi:hypothetical protein
MSVTVRISLESPIRDDGGRIRRYPQSLLSAPRPILTPFLGPLCGVGKTFNPIIDDRGIWSSSANGEILRRVRTGCSIPVLEVVINCGGVVNALLTRWRAGL